MLTRTRVTEVIMDCLFKEDEILNGAPKNPEDLVPVEGIINNMGLHKGRLASHRQEIQDMLRELPEEFHKESGGGMSFLNACIDREGNQWGQHRDMEALFVLGLGLGVVRYCLPREAWAMLPGGMPYLVVDVAEKTKEG